jgi:hypothetical protein
LVCKIAQYMCWSPYFFGNTYKCLLASVIKQHQIYLVNCLHIIKILMCLFQVAQNLNSISYCAEKLIKQGERVKECIEIIKLFFKRFVHNTNEKKNILNKNYAHSTKTFIPIIFNPCPNNMRFYTNFLNCL